MDAEKPTEVEMKEITPAEVQDDKDAEKGKTEGTKEAEKESAEKEKETKEEKEKANVSCKLKDPTEDVYKASISTSTPKSNEEAEKKTEEEKEKDKETKEEDVKEKETKEEDVKEKETKEEEEEKANVYCKLQKPTENIYNVSASTSTGKGKKESQKKAEKKEIEEEGNVYCKLKSPTEDIYNPSMSASTRKRSEAKKEEDKEDQEGEETALYCKLKDPSENVYMAAMSSSTKKHEKDVHRRLLLFKRLSAILAILCLVLLAVVLALALKCQSNQKCLDTTPKLPKSPFYPKPPVCRCTGKCDDGWVSYKKSCYFISKDRQGWYYSRQLCKKKGGDLAVIDDESVQGFLTGRFDMMYWIGLRFLQQKWIWVNDTEVTQSYWASGHPKSGKENFCALLEGNMSKTSNWISNPCKLVTHYICQKV